MGDLAAALAGSHNLAEHASRVPRNHPKGWEPGVETNGDEAVAVSEPMSDDNPDERALIEGWLLDPDEWEITGPVNCRRWQTYDERWLYYYKANLRRRVRGARVDIEQLVARVLKRKPRAVREGGGTAGLVVNWADWQTAKGDGDGIDGLMDRLSNMFGAVEDRWRDLRRCGVPLSIMYVNGMGDLREGCFGHYPQQQFRTQLNERDQRKVIRWAIDSALDSWSRVCPQIRVTAVGGNHGESARVDGKSVTDFADNVDVAVFEDVSYAFGKNPDRYEHVAFHLPNSDLTATYDHDGIIVGLAHGHQAGMSAAGDPKGRIDKWWRGQMAGKQPIGDADILITAHYHHPWMVRAGHRTHFGCPALEGDSEWWRNYAGQKAPPGTLTFVVDAAHPQGWHSMEIL